jgi:hypothetical protein
MTTKELATKQQINFELDGSNFREQVEYIENLMLNSDSPDIYKGNSDELPLTHSFSEGIYIREIFIKKGMFVIGKIHKLDHTFFLMKGKLLLCTEDGVKEIEAPYYGNATSGAKRVAFALEDAVFVNVHPNPDNIKEMKTLEDTFVVSSYEEFENYKLLNK